MLQRMLNRLRGANDDEKGFTLIELLVVVLIIGILAAIALPTFLGQQKKAENSAAKSDARNTVTQMESCLVDAADAAAATACGSSAPVTAQKLAVVSGVTAVAGGYGYVITATSKSTDKFIITKSATGNAKTSAPVDAKWDAG